MSATTPRAVQLSIRAEADRRARRHMQDLICENMDEATARVQAEAVREAYLCGAEEAARAALSAAALVLSVTVDEVLALKPSGDEGASGREAA